MFQGLRNKGFDIAVRNHAAAILSVDFPGEAGEPIETLADFTIGLRELISGGEVNRGKLNVCGTRCQTRIGPNTIS